MNFMKLIGAGTVAVMAAALSACQIDTTTAMRVSDIRGAARTGVPVAVSPAITAAFASTGWCQDEGAMAAGVLAKAGLPIEAAGCTSSAGQFRLAASLVRTEGGRDPSVVVGQVLGTDVVKFAVFPHGKRKELLSVGLFMNVAQLQGAEDQLVKMPVFKRGLYKGEVGFSFTIAITNDTPKPEKFYLRDVDAGGDLPADDSVLTVPPGGTDTIALDTDKLSKLQQQGWVNFFAMLK